MNVFSGITVAQVETRGGSFAIVIEHPRRAWRRRHSWYCLGCGTPHSRNRRYTRRAATGRARDHARICRRPS